MTLLNDAIVRIRKHLTARPQSISDGYTEEMCAGERSRDKCLMQVVRPGKFQCECDDILARVLDYVDEYEGLPLGSFMIEVADEIEWLRKTNENLMKSVGEENRANRMTHLYESSQKEIARLLGEIQDQQMHSEQDGCIAENLRDELNDVRWKLMHVVYCPPTKSCNTCESIEKSVRHGW